MFPFTDLGEKAMRMEQIAARMSTSNHSNLLIQDKLFESQLQQNVKDSLDSHTLHLNPGFFKSPIAANLYYLATCPGSAPVCPKSR